MGPWLCNAGLYRAIMSVFLNNLNWAKGILHVFDDISLHFDWQITLICLTVLLFQTIGTHYVCNSVTVSTVWIDAICQLLETKSEPRWHHRTSARWGGAAPMDGRKTKINNVPCTMISGACHIISWSTSFDTHHILYRLTINEICNAFDILHDLLRSVAQTGHVIYFICHATHFVLFMLDTWYMLWHESWRNTDVCLVRERIMTSLTNFKFSAIYTLGIWLYPWPMIPARRG